MDCVNGKVKVMLEERVLKFSYTDILKYISENYGVDEIEIIDEEGIPGIYKIKEDGKVKEFVVEDYCDGFRR